MPSIFEKPLENITKQDIEELLGSAERAGCPENETVEFNGPLPQKKDDRWLHNREITDYTKKEVFKEIVALANTAGGHFFLGIKETESDEKPPTAASITPLPRCVELADRLKRSADGLIDPPIPGFNACGVVTKDDGSSGVVIFRVPQSRSAPHHLKLGMECYVRRGDESVPISMREIQDLTIHLSRRMDEIKRRFDRAHEEFLKWLYPHGPDGAIGLRVTAVPVGASLYVDRVYPKVAEKVLNVRSFNAELSSPFQGKGLSPLIPLSDPSFLRPIFRGARKEFSNRASAASFSAYSDGVIEILSCFRGPFFALEWTLNHVANVVKAARAFAEAAGAPECEYGMAFELRCAGNPPDASFEVGLLEPIAVADNRREKVDAPLLVEEPLTLGDRDALMNRVLADICDACHMRIAEPPAIKIDWDD